MPIVIIGAGVTGLSTAYHLKRLGAEQVIIVEKDRVGSGSSRRAAGITTGLLWTDTGVKARKIATKWFRRLSDQLEGYQYYNDHGCLNLLNPELWEQRVKLLELYDRHEAPYQILDRTEMRRRWPQINPPSDFVGLHDPLGGFSEPPHYLESMERHLRSAGVKFLEGATVSDFVRKGERIAAVVVGEETIPTGAVVSTTYAWTLPLLDRLGVRLPAKTFLHQRFVSNVCGFKVSIPPINADPFFGYIRPTFDNRLLLGIETPDVNEVKVTDFAFSMNSLEVNWDLVPGAVERFSDFFPAISDLSWETAEVGLLSFSMDGEPIVGQVADLANLFAGFSFHSGGFSYNTASGLFLAELALGRSTSIDLQAFSPNRFDPSETDSYLESTIPQRNAVRRRH